MRIPVVWSCGQWKLKVIAPIQFNEGAVGELIVDSAGPTDRSHVLAANERRQIAVLPAGAELRVALSIEGKLHEHLREAIVQGPTPHDITANISNRSRFVSVWLRGSRKKDLFCGDEPAGLWFLFTGTARPRIGTGIVELPDIGHPEPVDSLNHAFTLLSENFEPWRQAHTGSIYERVFYKQSEKRWGPLKELRSQAIKDCQAPLATE